jgi:hypothetical protein
MTEMEEKNIAEEFFSHFLNKKFQFTYHWPPIKDVQTTGEAFCPSKKFINFLYFCVIFALLGQDTDPGIPLDPVTDPDLDPHTVRNAGNFICSNFQPP